MKKAEEMGNAETVPKKSGGQPLHGVNASVKKIYHVSLGSLVVGSVQAYY